MRVADVDRHPAPPLLGQPIGVDPRGRAAAWSCRGRCGRPCRRQQSSDDGAHRGRQTVVGVGGTVRRSRITRSSSMRPITAGVPRRSAANVRVADLVRSASPTDGSVSPGSDPPPTVLRTSIDITVPIGASIPSMNAIARSRNASRGVAIIRQTGSLPRPDRRDTARASARRRRARPCPGASPEPVDRAASGR